MTYHLIAVHLAIWTSTDSFKLPTYLTAYEAKC